MIHMYKDQPVGGAIPFQVIPLETDEEYEALTPAQKSDPTKAYLIEEGVVMSGEIDDNDVSASKAWSSEKVNSEFDTIDNKFTYVGDYGCSGALFYDGWGGICVTCPVPFKKADLNTKYRVVLTSMSVGYQNKANVELDVSKVAAMNVYGEFSVAAALVDSGVSDTYQFMKEYPHGVRYNYRIEEVTQS